MKVKVGGISLKTWEVGETVLKKRAGKQRPVLPISQFDFQTTYILSVPAGTFSGH